MNRLTANLTLSGALLISVTVTSALTVTRKASFRPADSSPIRTGIGDAPVSVAIGDFNGDGFIDLVVANSSENTVSMLLGHGDGTFSSSAGSPFSTGGNLTTAVAVGDFNNDGKLDIVAIDIPGGLSGFFNGITGSLGGNVSVFLGDGAGSFGGHQDSDGGGDFPGSIAVGDFNRDGNLDVAVANFDNQDLSVLLGHGNGSFDQANNSPIHMGHRPTAVAVGDLNLDGKQDIVIANAEDNNIVILLGRGDGTFSAGSNSPISVGARPVYIAIADYNGDGKPDLAIANLLSSTVSIFFGDGTGAFQFVRDIRVARYPCSIAVADFDNDGKLDMAVANRLSELISVHLGDGAGSFGPARNFGVEGHPQSLVAADFNGDGQPDLAVGNVASNSVSVVLNNTDITPPVLTMPSLASSYLLNASVTFNFSATDAQSGIASMLATFNGVPITSGTTVTLSHLGINTFVFTATDNNANIASRAVTFAVNYKFGGFLPPVTTAATTVFKKNDTLPISFQLSDVNGALVSTAVATLTVQLVSNNVPVGTPIDATAPGNADAGNLFRYDGQKYRYNLSTTPLSAGTWQVQARLDDGTVHSVVIATK
jgi:hypothetical protein